MVFIISVALGNGHKGRLRRLILLPKCEQKGVETDLLTVVPCSLYSNNGNSRAWEDETAIGGKGG